MQEPILRPKNFIEIATALEELREDIKYHLQDKNFKARSHHVVELAKVHMLYFEGSKLASNLQRHLINKMLADVE